MSGLSNNHLLTLLIIVLSLVLSK